jgi:hypothetical protein
MRAPAEQSTGVGPISDVYAALTSYPQLTEGVHAAVQSSQDYAQCINSQSYQAEWKISRRQAEHISRDFRDSPNLPITRVCASISPDVNLRVNHVPRNRAAETELAECEEGKPNSRRQREVVVSTLSCDIDDTTDNLPYSRPCVLMAFSQICCSA